MREAQKNTYGSIKKKMKYNSDYYRKRTFALQLEQYVRRTF